MTGVTVFHGGPWDGQLWQGAASMSSIPVPGAPRPAAYQPVTDRLEDLMPPLAGRYERHGQPFPIGLGRVLVIYRWWPAVTGPPPDRPELPVRELERLTKLMFQHPDLADHG